METQDSDYHEVPSTPYVLSQCGTSTSFEVPASPVINRHNALLSWSQTSSAASGQEQNVPGTPATSSTPSKVATSASESGSSMSSVFPAEQRVPRTPRAQRVQNIVNTWARNGWQVSGSATTPAHLGPGSRRTREQQRRIEAMTPRSRATHITHLFQEDNIFA